jgi:hypothetical protein
MNSRVAGEEPRESSQSLWGWVAVGILGICWIAEAALYAARGF